MHCYLGVGQVETQCWGAEVEAPGWGVLGCDEQFSKSSVLPVILSIQLKPHLLHIEVNKLLVPHLQLPSVHLATVEAKYPLAIPMAAAPIRQTDQVKLSEIITQINPDYRPPHIFRLKQWLFSFCSCFQPHEVDMERLCQGEDFLLPPASSSKKTLVLDLDETLVHSVFSQVGEADFTIPVDIGGKVITIFVRVRPGVDRFLSRMAELYELVIYTASLGKYADPLLDRIDPRNHVTYRLFRESCTISRGSYIKDLSRLGRDLRSVIIIDVRTISELPGFLFLSP